MFLAVVPNLSVDIVSITLYGDGEHVMIRAVLELPPRDSESSLVNLDSLYGMKLPFLFSVNALITLPKADSDLLMPLASFKVWPDAPVFPTFSEPARSTRNSLPLLQDPSSVLF